MEPQQKQEHTMSLLLDIITPEASVYKGTVDYVGLPARDGQIGILPRHIPLLAALGTGSLYFRQGEKTEYIFISGGFVDISSDQVTILTETAECAADIDLERARRAFERAQARVRSYADNVDMVRAETALMRSIMRISTVQRYY
jgi:F-type H+-transporting ATPase subunit epsilon